MTEGLLETSVFRAEVGESEMYESDHSTEGTVLVSEGGEAESRLFTAALRRDRAVVSGLEVWREP